MSLPRYYIAVNGFRIPSKSDRSIDTDGCCVTLGQLQCHLYPRVRDVWLHPY